MEVETEKIEELDLEKAKIALNRLFIEIWILMIVGQCSEVLRRICIILEYICIIVNRWMVEIWI